MTLALRNTLPTKAIIPMTHTIHRHANYNKLRDVIARYRIADMEYIPTCEEIEQREGIGRSSVSRHIQTLVHEGWLRRVILGNSNRSIYYKIMIDKNKAIEYRLMFTPSGRKKNSKNIMACDNRVIYRGV